MKVGVYRDDYGITIEGLYGSFLMSDLTDVQAEDLARALNRVASGREESAEVDLS